MAIKELSVDLIKEKLFQNQKTVLLYFYLNWFTPSEELLETLEEIQEETEDLEFYKFDFSKNKDIAKKNFEITSLPTIIIFDKGQEKYRLSGTQTKKQLKIMISSYKKLLLS